MALLPLLFSAWWAELDRPHRLMDQNFGLGLFPEQLIAPPRIWDRACSTLSDRAAMEHYYRPVADILRRDEGGTSTITSDKDMFKVILDVQQFKPEEINVKLADRFVVVEAKHEEKKDEHGFISRQFVRKYMLPEQVDADKVTSNISSDGILTIMAPLKELEDQKPNEKTIKIEFTGKPAIRGDTKPTQKAVAEETETTEETPKTESEENKTEK